MYCLHLLVLKEWPYVEVVLLGTSGTIPRARCSRGIPSVGCVYLPIVVGLLLMQSPWWTGFVPQTSWLCGLAENAVDTLEGGAGPSPGCLVDLTVNMWVYWCVWLIPWSGNHFGRVLMLAKSSHQMDSASPPEQEPLWRGASASQGCPLGGGGWEPLWRGWLRCQLFLRGTQGVQC